MSFDVGRDEVDLDTVLQPMLLDDVAEPAVRQDRTRYLFGAPPLSHRARLGVLRWIRGGRASRQHHARLLPLDPRLTLTLVFDPLARGLRIDGIGVVTDEVPFGANRSHRGR